MVSLLKEQENFLRNAILTVDHSKEVLQCFIDQHLKNNHQTFEEFLNQNQHDIYHLYYDAKCCQCGPGPLQKKKIILFASQMELLFDKNRQLSVHKTTRRSDFCCCTAKNNVTTAVLDLTLARCLLMNCCIDMFWYSCLAFKGVTLEQFLNSNKHILYHLWKNNDKCCKCQPDFIFPCNAPLIMESEWKKMFSSTLPPCENDRKRPVNGAISICAFSATPGITIQQIHLELQGIIIKFCCSTRKSVEKLAELRNVTFGHAKKASMSCTEFNTFMSESEEAIFELATVCGKEDYYKQRLLDLLDKPLDSRMFRQYEMVLLQTICNYKDILEENETLKDGIQSLQNTNAEIKEKIENLNKLQAEGSKRQRLIDHTSTAIECHLKEDTYVEIEAVRHCIQILEHTNVVILSGRDGCGKSRNGIEILRQLRDKHKNVLKLERPCDVLDITKCNMTTVIFFDDIFDKTEDQISRKQILDNLYTYISQHKIKLIFTMRNNVKHLCQTLLATHKLFRGSVNIDINSEEFELTLHEKEMMINNYCEVNKIQISDTNCKLARIFLLNGYRSDEPESTQSVSKDGSVVVKREVLNEILQTDPFVGFSECCRLFTEHQQSTVVSVGCFKWPPYSCFNDIEKLRIEGKDSYTKGLQYVTLIYMLKQITSHENYQHYLLGNSKVKCLLRIENINAQICKDIFKVCYHRSLEVRAIDIKDACTELEYRYLVKKDGTYYFQHQSIQDSVLISYYQIEPKAIIPLLSFDHVMDIVQLQNYREKNGEIVIKISGQNYDEFAHQLILLFEICHADSKFPKKKFESLIESKMNVRDIDIAYHLIFGIQNRHETFQRFSYNDLLFYILRAILNIDGNRLSVSHVKDKMFVSVCLEHKRNTFAINPSIFIRLASRYEGTLKWLLLNTDHSLLNLNEILMDFVYIEDKEYVLFILKNLNHKLVDMTTFFSIVCLQSDGKLDLVDWFIDFVDNSRIDFNKFFTQLLPDCNHPNKYINEVVLHVLKRADDTIVNFHSILNKEILIDYIIESCLLFRNFRVYSYEIYENIVEILLVIPGIKISTKVRLLYWASRHKWFGVIEMLIKQDSERVLDIKTIIDAWNDDTDPHWQKLIQLLLEYYSDDIDINEIMERACEVRSNSIIEIIINSYSDDVDLNKIMGNACYAGNCNVVEYLLNHFDHELFNFHTIFDKSLSQRPVSVNNMFGNRDIIFSLVLEKVNNNLFNSDVIKNMMNAACHFGHVQPSL